MRILLVQDDAAVADGTSVILQVGADTVLGTIWGRGYTSRSGRPRTFLGRPSNQPVPVTNYIAFQEINKMLDRLICQDLSKRATFLMSCASVLAVMLVVPSASLATVFPTGFAGPSLDPGLVEDGTAGTSYSVGGGQLVLRQAAGEGNGQVTVSMISPVTGNFSLSITASAANLGRADLGIVLGTADWSHTLADVFINGLGQSVNGNIFQPDFAGAFLPNTVGTLTLEITRTGDEIRDIYNSDSGPVVINSRQDPLLNGPVTVSLFLLEAASDKGPHQGTFGSFSVAPPLDAAVSEPSSVAVFALGVIAIYRLTTRVAGLDRRRLHGSNDT